MNRTFNRSLLALLAVVFLSNMSFAQAAYDLLRIDGTPRGAALGQMPVALAVDELSTSTINPAGLALLEGQHVMATFAEHPLDLASGLLTYGRPLKQGYLTFSMNYFSYGEFDRRTDIESPADGTFNASDVLANVGYGRNVMSGISVGVNAKYLYSKIEEYSSSAVALDLAGLWETGLSNVCVAAGLYNVGAQLSVYDTTGEELPTTARLGFAKKLEHLPLTVTATAHYELDDELIVSGGGEFVVSPLLRLRAGYSTMAADYKVDGNSDTLAGFSAGIGLTHRQFLLDYSFQSQGALGEIHRLGLTYSI